MMSVDARRVRKKVEPVVPEDFGLDPNEIYYVTEPVHTKDGGDQAREVFESKDIYCCLAKSRTLGPGAKVHRRRDGAVLALRAKGSYLDGREHGRAMRKAGDGPSAMLTVVSGAVEFEPL